ncbi:immunoglobulin superfamily member 1-like [Emys orbicularis]|uniref:immunoglobulin superfamily member 1-like n=1 Tax=Emys orbicularis TaxID=82168 RepID=UPI0031FDF9D7
MQARAVCPDKRGQDKDSDYCLDIEVERQAGTMDPAYTGVYYAETPELSAPRPSISISPSGVIALGAAVTIRCQCRCEARRLFVYKGGIEIREPDAAGDRGEFTIPSTRREDGGFYKCQSHSRSELPSWSDPSDIVRIIETYYPKPSISLLSSGGVILGGAVTIHCRGRHQNAMFLLYKDGNLKMLQDAEPAQDMAEFPISNVNQGDAGSYSCRYSNKLDPPVWSEPSDPLELLVAELSYPKPNISLSPSGGVSLGGAVTVWCRGQRRGMRFMLNKERSHFPPVDSNGFQAVFRIKNVSREDGGNYSCSYHRGSEPLAVSYPSDPMELVVRDPNLPRPSISLSPTGVTAPEADATIRCQGQRRNMTFFLHKAGDLNPQQQMDPGVDGAEFRIPTVGRQHGGNYSCSYRPQPEPFVSSQLSDTVQLVVAAAPLDFTNTNIARLGLGATVLLVLGLILAEAYYSRPRGTP